MMLQDLVCTNCHHKFEELVKKDSLPECPKCGNSTLKIDIAVPNFQFKGSGWSRDGYAGGLYNAPKDRREQDMETRKSYSKQFDKKD